MGSVLRRIFPFLGWIGDYKPSTLRADFVAGLTVALVLIPQSMAYAQLAGLPAYYGLYAAFLPPMIASLFGSSRQLATGPVAIVSLMTSAALEPIATAGSEQYITYAILLALSVGIFQLLLGLLRLGLVVNLLSHPVVNGFTCAAALIIATSQLSKVFGVYVDKAEHHYETVFRVILAAIHYTHWPTLGMAVLAFGVMIVLKKVNPKIPNVLVAVLITTVLSVLLGFRHDEETGLARIHPEEVHDEVRKFNTIVQTLEESESLRTETNAAMAAMSSSKPKDSPTFCGQCHSPRDVAAFEHRSEGEIAAHSDHVTTIHQMAGLVDGYIEVLREQASEIRTELRAHHFEKALDTDGRPSFYLRGHVPEGLTGDGAHWRIKIGSKPLDPEKISVSGGGAVVGTIPKGLPDIKLPDVRNNIGTILGLIPAAIVISLLGFMEAISIAKAMAAKTRQKLDPNQELIGQGLANIVGCCGQSYACSGSFSRSAVNLQAGARTGMSNVFSSGVVVVVLLFLTPLLYHLPQAVLAAIIMMAVVGLLNVSGFVHAWRVKKFDGMTGIVSFAGTLVFAPHLEWGIVIGVVLAIGGYLLRSMRPKVARLAPHPDGSLRDAQRHQLAQCRHLAIIRFDGPLNFASVSYLEDEILGEVADMPELKHILVDADGINEIDASGEEMLRHLIQQLRGGGYSVSFSALGDDIVNALQRAHLYEYIGENHVFSTQAQAVAAIYAMAHASSTETDCPLRSLMPRVTEISLHPDGALRDAHRRNLPVCQHIAVLRFDDPLNFANATFLEEEILKMVSDRPSLRQLMFAAQGVADLDADGAEKLSQLVTS
ncbi:MAG: STAS domain-containing protein, partial [Planctomycetes bacterium]|nr:STAS domain-containing protein [Planctomycetota bacterium]